MTQSEKITLFLIFIGSLYFFIKKYSEDKADLFFAIKNIFLPLAYGLLLFVFLMKAACDRQSIDINHLSDKIECERK